MPKFQSESINQLKCTLEIFKWLFTSRKFLFHMNLYNLIYRLAYAGIANPRSK